MKTIVKRTKQVREKRKVCATGLRKRIKDNSEREKSNIFLTITEVSTDMPSAARVHPFPRDQQKISRAQIILRSE